MALNGFFVIGYFAVGSPPGGQGAREAIEVSYRLPVAGYLLRVTDDNENIPALTSCRLQDAGCKFHVQVRFKTRFKLVTCNLFL